MMQEVALNEQVSNFHTLCIVLVCEVPYVCMLLPTFYGGSVSVQPGLLSIFLQVSTQTIASAISTVFHCVEVTESELMSAGSCTDDQAFWQRQPLPSH